MKKGIKRSAAILREDLGCSGREGNEGIKL